MGLALVPLLLSTLLGGRWMAGRGRTVSGAVVVVWLLFLPNAPYLLTDLIHLQPTPVMPQWFDVLLYFSCGWNGLLLYYLSLFDVQYFLAARYSHGVRWPWIGGVFVLSGFGVYVGRYLRLNSWDVFSNPLLVLNDIATALVNPLYWLRIVGMTFGYGLFLALGYLVLRELMRGERGVMGNDTVRPSS
jgi:uncharacterized membrane protein